MYSKNKPATPSGRCIDKKKVWHLQWLKNSTYFTVVRAKKTKFVVI